MTTRISRSFQIEAHAKVNLCLAVAFPPEDGFHRLESVFQTLDLHDTLVFEDALAEPACDAVPTALGTPVELSCTGVDLDVRDNLVFRAVEAAERACGQRAVPAGHVLRVSVEKRIPAGGGLGGGSSDAAACLRAFARLHNANPLGSELLSAARELGADVAFFLYGGAALMGGRGDVLERCLPDFPLPLVLMGDEHGCSTPAVYRRFDEEPTPAPDARALAAAMERADAPAEDLASLCGNNLQPAACAELPALAARLAKVQADPDALAAQVTGSGSTGFAICTDEASASRLAARVAPECAWTLVAHAHEGQ